MLEQCYKYNMHRLLKQHFLLIVVFHSTAKLLFRKFHPYGLTYKIFSCPSVTSFTIITKVLKVFLNRLLFARNFSQYLTSAVNQILHYLCEGFYRNCSNNNNKYIYQSTNKLRQLKMCFVFFFLIWNLNRKYILKKMELHNIIYYIFMYAYFF